MGLNKESKQKLIEIWKDYVNSGKKLILLKGKETTAAEIDRKRKEESEVMKKIINEFLNKELDVKSFKSTLDSENKRNNYWGFTAIKGQMFFNQLTSNYENNLEKISRVLRDCIKEPKDLNEAKQKIDKLEQHTRHVFDEAEDKRKAPNPKSIPYFLSYFWQIFNHKKWPIHYTSMVKTLKKLDEWEEQDKQSKAYEYFHNKINEMKDYLESELGKNLSHWDIEHSFWWYQNKEKESSKTEKTKEIIEETDYEVDENVSFDYNLYIPPIVSDLIEMGENYKDSDSIGYDFEKKVTLVFKMLDFTIEELGQGKGREPDLLAFLRPENTAFIIDAKARKGGYNIGTDDRAIKEYIRKYVKDFRHKGYKKTGFIIVSSNFKSDPDKFIDEITLETDIKRLTLLTSKALLFLLAFKLKESIGINQITNILLTNGTINSDDIIEVFEDI